MIHLNNYMKYSRENATILSGLWWGLSRGFLSGFALVLSQMVWVAFFIDELKDKSYKTAGASVVGFIASLWLPFLVFFTT